MTQESFYKLVYNMRFAQKKYFQNKETKWLITSKQAERDVDKRLDEYLAPVFKEQERKEKEREKEYGKQNKTSDINKPAVQ